MIFESPDHGNTVYGRMERIDITQESLELNHLWFQWRDILTASKYNPALKEALDKAQIIYELSRYDKD
jgi:hypothetical protein